MTGGGAITYGAGGRPHTVATARGGQSFSYHDNGNVLFDGGRNYPVYVGQIGSVGDLPNSQIELMPRQLA
ncbi:hypothetical protein J4E05_16740 [Thalassospira sp. NFXS8]|uniref:hypothetical protein n=1 Tax=Thalassospira sp. NFXS8 TaxID=2819093 RepID=UPI0032DE6F17